MHASSAFTLSLVLAGLAALAPFAIDTYLPAFPGLELALVASPLELQQSLTFYL
jgi:DHA1 family bicyclomycin/chloramphenicol resistance-like MFS transporter